MTEIKRLIRATTRAALGIAIIPPFLGLTALQGFVVGPLLNNHTAIPNFLYRSLRKLVGIKVVFNAASAPLVKDRSTWFVSNHVSVADFVVLGGTLEGTFAGKGDVLKWPVVAQMARAVKYIGLRRSREFNAQSRAKIITNFNAGFNTIMFPEGTTTDGKAVRLFHAGLITLLFGEKGVDSANREVVLKKDVVVQPVAIRVKTVEGVDAAGNDALLDLYAMYTEDNPLKRVWRRMQLQNVTVELTVFEPLKPADFQDAKGLINAAALKVASVVNPGQTTFEKAKIPGQDNKPSVPKGDILVKNTPAGPG